MGSMYWEILAMWNIGHPHKMFRGLFDPAKKKVTEGAWVQHTARACQF